MEIDLKEIRQMFFQDADDHLEEMEKALSNLESDCADGSAIGELFRAVHSLKGDSGAAGLDVIGTSLHRLETELERMRSGECRTTEQTVGAMRDVVDEIHHLIEAVKTDEAVRPELEKAVTRLVALDSCESLPAEETADAPATPVVTFSPAADFGLFEDEEPTSASGSPTSVTVPIKQPQEDIRVAKTDASRCPTFFGDYLIECGLLTIDQVLTVLNAQKKSQPMLGELLVKAGHLTVKEVMRTLVYSSAMGDRMGETAVRLGYLQIEDLNAALDEQRQARPGFRNTAVDLGILDRESIDSAFEGFLAQYPHHAASLIYESSALPTPPQPTVATPVEQPTAGAVREDFDSDPELLAEFIGESHEHLEIAEEQLLIIESDPENSEALNAIYRSFHTIKGVSSFLGLEDTRHLAHQAESMLNLARDGKLELSGDAFEIALSSVDGLKRQVGIAERWLSTQGPLDFDPELAGLLAAIDAVSNGRPVPEILPMVDAKDAVDNVSSETSTSPPEPSASPGSDPASTPAASPAAKPEAKRTKPAGGQNEGVTQIKESVKVDRDRLDKLINVIGELVIGQAMVEEEVATWQAETGQESMAMSQLNKTVRDLQELSLSLRMVPIGTVFHKMARIVRDLGRKLGKNISFETEGNETELDKTVVDQIGDPLLHMVRNAADHGVELPDVREAAGKPARGRICLRAYHQGGNIYVEIQDDGKGLDRDRLLQKAIERGIVAESDNLSDQEILNLIFAPGFSTAKEVTDVSGRGVGMDVVRRNVEALQGSVSIASVKGSGSTVTIRLPLTLAILDGLSIRVGQEVYIVPILSVVESFSPQPQDLRKIAGKGEVVMVRGEVVPLLRLARLFGSASRRQDSISDSLVVIVEDRGKKFALLVDELLGQSQVVIKNLETNYQKVEGIAGATILGDGRIAMIVDVFGLVALASQGRYPASDDFDSIDGECCQVETAESKPDQIGAIQS